MRLVVPTMASELPTAPAGARCVTKTNIGTARIDPPPPKMPSDKPITPLSNTETRRWVMLRRAAGEIGRDGKIHLFRIGQPEAPHQRDILVLRTHLQARVVSTLFADRADRPAFVVVP